MSHRSFFFPKKMCISRPYYKCKRTIHNQPGFRILVLNSITVNNFKEFMNQPVRLLALLTWHLNYDKWQPASSCLLMMWKQTFELESKNSKAWNSIIVHNSKEFLNLPFPLLTLLTWHLNYDKWQPASRCLLMMWEQRKPCMKYVSILTFLTRNLKILKP